MPLILTVLAVLAVNFPHVTAQSELGFFACIIRCRTNGKIVPNIGQGCRMSSSECSMAYDPSTALSICEATSYQQQFLYVDYVNFNTNGQTQCEDYYASIIQPVATNREDIKNETVIQEAQCGCTDMLQGVFSLALASKIPADTLCSQIYTKFDPTNRVCTVSKKSKFAKAICENAFGVVNGKVEQLLFNPTCGLMLRIFKEVSGINLDAAYTKAKSEFDKLVDTASRRICGTLTCNKELSKYCLKSQLPAGGNTASVLTSISSAYCTLTGKSNSADCITSKYNEMLLAAGISATVPLLFT